MAAAVEEEEAAAAGAAVEDAIEASAIESVQIDLSLFFSYICVNKVLFYCLFSSWSRRKPL